MGAYFGYGLSISRTIGGYLLLIDGKKRWRLREMGGAWSAKLPHGLEPVIFGYPTARAAARRIIISTDKDRRDRLRRVEWMRIAFDNLDAREADFKRRNKHLFK